MNAVSRITRIGLSVVAVVAVALVVLVEFTDYCRLTAVTLDGRPVSDFPARFPLDPTSTIANQPVDLVAAQLLDDQGIVRVSIDYELPGALHISTNDFTPDCLMVDEMSGNMFGMDYNGRVIPIKDSLSIWNLPILTGIGARRLYGYCDDLRTQLLVPRLHELRATHPQEYEMIEEIDFSNDNYLTVTVAGALFPIRATADEFAEQLHHFFTFVTNYDADLTCATLVDLRFAPMIVRAGQPDTTDTNATGGHN